MGKKLVIVESPAKAKTINKILGGDYIVTSSVGHVRDLPERSIGVDIEHDFKPKYVLTKGKQKVVDQLKRDAAKCDEIFLAPDPDREGEAIAWHIREILAPGCAGKPFRRIQYNEITARAVREAFAHPGEIDMHRVDAQQARRVLDRLVGYKVSPMLWRRIRRGLSAGRVQSVALRLVCEREALIDKFVPEPYWVMGATVRKLVVPLDPFSIKLARINDEKADVSREEQATGILRELESRKLVVREIVRKPVTRRAPPPFITSSLQQAGSSFCGLSPRRTMALAQRLYEGVDFGDGPVGLITYMRTDSVTVSREAQEACRGWVAQTFGQDFIPATANVYKSRGGAQEAHEAIRPTDVTLTPDRLKGKVEAAEQKLYRLIWERFVASQMAPARIEQITVKIDAPPAEGQTNTYLFHASASDVLFAGYQKVLKPGKSGKADGAEDGEDEEQKLPPLAEGEPLECLEWLSDRKETKPPPRFSEASLVRELETNGVGRPSTYAQIISTLQQREYVTREKRMLIPSGLGRQVNQLLVETLGDLFDVTFTASMESLLDQVESGDVKWTEMLGHFYDDFEKWMAAARLPPANSDQVDRVLTLLTHVTAWAPEVKRGKRTYSDERFVASIREQLEKGEREVSQRQLEALVKMAFRYREQIDGAEQALGEMGFGEMMASPELQPPREATERKLALVRALELNERTRSFVDSLDGRVKSGRSLTPAQRGALNNVLLDNAARIENFESLRAELEIETEAEEDSESGPLLGALETVTAWKPPVERGKRTFDDKQFYDSLAGQFKARGSLSPRQRAALKRLVARYRAQVPDFEKLAEAHGIGGGKKR